MNPETVEAFINCTHERYKNVCGKYFGKEIPGIFTDEPCYLMVGQYGIPCLPWSEYLPEYFKNLKGYSIEDNLESLFFDTGNYNKIRFDFFDSATRLFMESFTKKYYDWCENNNLIMTGHFMAEDDLVYQTQWIGAAMPHYQFMHWPGIDKLGRHLKQLVTVKQVTSVVDQLDKERAFCEVFGCIGQQSSFYHRKWIADWEAALGIGFVNSHLSLYSMRGERKRDYPANLFYQQPWWDFEKPFADYIGRLSYAVSTGKREVDILVIHPIGSVWSEYSPLHKKTGFAVENNIYNKPFEDLSKNLIANNLDFHYGDEIIMEKHATIEGNKLVIGSHEYSTIIVPPCSTLRENTIKLLDKFVEKAGKNHLIFTQIFPRKIDGIDSNVTLPDKGLKLNNIDDVITVVCKYYENRIQTIDKMTGNNAEKIITHARNTDEGKIIFFANTDDKREIQANIKICDMKNPKILDLMSGEIYNIPSTYIDNKCNIDVTFYPAGSMLIIETAKPMECKNSPQYLDSGIEFPNTSVITNIIDNREINVLEDNVLPLNDVTLYMAGEQVLNNEPVSKAWHNYFYPAPDGTPFRAEYNFDVLNIPKNNIYAAVETAENLDRIIINGKEVKPLKEKGELGIFDNEKSWKDISFTKVPLTGLIREGKNTLILEGKKINNVTRAGCHNRIENFKQHMPTEVETVYIIGDFHVISLDRENFIIDSKKPIPNCSDLISSGYPFYAGKVEYTSKFNCTNTDDKTYLKINDVKTACVELYVNTKPVSIKYWKPYIFDVTKYLIKGENDIKIIASNTLFNLMGPGRIAGIKDIEFVRPYTFIDDSKFTKQYQFMPFSIGSAVIMKL